MVCDMHTTKIFIILNFSLVVMLSFWCHFEKYSLNRLWACCKLGNITFLVIWCTQNTTRTVVCFLHKFPTGAHFWTYAPWLLYLVYILNPICSLHFILTDFDRQFFRFSLKLRSFLSLFSVCPDSRLCAVGVLMKQLLYSGLLDMKWS